MRKILFTALLALTGCCTAWDGVGYDKTGEVALYNGEYRDVYRDDNGQLYFFCDNRYYPITASSTHDSETVRLPGTLRSYGTVHVSMYKTSPGRIGISSSWDGDVDITNGMLDFTEIISGFRRNTDGVYWWPGVSESDSLILFPLTIDSVVVIQPAQGNELEVRSIFKIR